MRTAAELAVWLEEVKYKFIFAEDEGVFELDAEALAKAILKFLLTEEGHGEKAQGEGEKIGKQGGSFPIE